MEKLDINDFFQNHEFLKEKYEYLARGTEGYVYKVSNNLVGKKFYGTRPLYLKEVSDAIKNSGEKSFLQPLFYLEKNQSLHAAFIRDIYLMSENNVELCDIYRSNIMYNEKGMAVIDTTKYQFGNGSSTEQLNQNNLHTLFVDSEAFNIPILERLAKEEKVLASLIPDLQNFNYMLIELKKAMEKRAECEVHSIRDGIEKIKKNKKML